MTHPFLRLAAVTCAAAAALTACSPSPAKPVAPAATSAGDRTGGADPAVVAKPGSTPSGTGPTTWAQRPVPGAGAAATGRTGTATTGTATTGPATTGKPTAGMGRSAPAARTAMVTTSVTADLRLPADLMSLRQMTLVRAAGLTVVAGGRAAQAFDDAGRPVWSTKLGGLLEIGQAVRVGDRVVTASSPAAGNGKLLLQFLDASTGGVVLDVPVNGDAVAMAPARVGASDVVVVVTDSGRAGWRSAFALDGHGRRLWTTDVPARTRRVEVSGGTAAFTQLPDWAPDNTVIAGGTVTFVDVRTGASRHRAPVAPNVLEESVVATSTGWWVPTGDSVWTRFTEAGQRTTDRADTAVRGAGAHAFTWVNGWSADGKPSARLSPSSAVLADTAAATLWFDPASPFPVTATNPADGRVMGGLSAPAGLNVTQSATGLAVQGRDVFALTCTPVATGADACSAFSVTRWPLP